MPKIDYIIHKELKEYRVKIGQPFKSHVHGHTGIDLEFFADKFNWLGDTGRVEHITKIPEGFGYDQRIGRKIDITEIQFNVKLSTLMAPTFEEGVFGAGCLCPNKNRTYRVVFLLWKHLCMPGDIDGQRFQDLINLGISPSFNYFFTEGNDKYDKFASPSLAVLRPEHEDTASVLYDSGPIVLNGTSRDHTISHVDDPANPRTLMFTSGVHSSVTLEDRLFYRFESQYGEEVTEEGHHLNVANSVYMFVTVDPLRDTHGRPIFNLREFQNWERFGRPTLDFTCKVRYFG